MFLFQPLQSWLWSLCSPCSLFSPGIFRACGKPSAWVGTCSCPKPWGEVVSQPLLCRACFFPGSGSQRDMGSSGRWQGRAGSYRLLPDPLTVVLFLQQCWNWLPPELLTELCWESLGMTLLVSLLSPAPPPRAFCSRNKARRGHAANMCQELQRRKLAAFTSNHGVTAGVLAPAERLFICGLSFITTGCSRLGVPADPTSEGFAKGKLHLSLVAFPDGRVRKD